LSNDQPFLCEICGKIGRVMCERPQIGGGVTYEMRCECGNEWGVNRWVHDRT